MQFEYNRGVECLVLSWAECRALGLWWPFQRENVPADRFLGLCAGRLGDGPREELEARGASDELRDRASAIGVPVDVLVAADAEARRREAAGILLSKMTEQYFAYMQADARQTG